MKSPWNRKNPFMSLALSGANAVAGSIRGRASAAAKRQASALITRGFKQAAGLWGSALIGAPAKKKKRRSR